MITATRGSTRWTWDPCGAVEVSTSSTSDPLVSPSHPLVALIETPSGALGASVSATGKRRQVCKAPCDLEDQVRFL